MSIFSLESAADTGADIMKAECIKKDQTSWGKNEYVSEFYSPNGRSVPYLFPGPKSY